MFSVLQGGPHYQRALRAREVTIKREMEQWKKIGISAGILLVIAVAAANLGADNSYTELDRFEDRKTEVLQRLSVLESTGELMIADEDIVSSTKDQRIYRYNVVQKDVGIIGFLRIAGDNSQFHTTVSMFHDGDVASLTRAAVILDVAMQALLPSWNDNPQYETAASWIVETTDKGTLTDDKTLQSSIQMDGKDIYLTVSTESGGFELDVIERF
jgi:hypothetical protein